jgi:hypothetical protein
MSWQIASWLLFGGSTVLMLLGLPVVCRLLPPWSAWFGKPPYPVSAILSVDAGRLEPAPRVWKNQGAPNGYDSRTRDAVRI